MTGDTDNLNLYKTKTGKVYESYEFCEPHLIKRQDWYKEAENVWEVISSKTVNGVFKEELKRVK